MAMIIMRGWVVVMVVRDPFRKIAPHISFLYLLFPASTQPFFFRGDRLIFHGGDDDDDVVDSPISSRIQYNYDVCADGREMWNRKDVVMYFAYGWTLFMLLYHPNLLFTHNYSHSQVSQP